MKTKKLILILAAPLSVAFTLQLQAQLVADGDSLDLTTATNLLPGDLIVGTNGGDTSLTLTGPGGMVDDAMGELGLNASSSNNSVTVTGAGAFWTNSGRLYVGEQGSGNQLRILDGGTVVNDISRLGDQSSSTNNHALVSGNGSRWLNNGNLNVGLSGSANFLTISNGGSVVDNANGIIGSQPPGWNNQVVVTGPGSTWTNIDLKVGFSASGSSLTVTDAATTVVEGDLYIGQNAASTNNRATLAGGNILVAGTTDVRRGALTLNGGLFSTTNLLATNGTESAIVFNGGTLVAAGGTISNSLPLVVGENPGGADAILDVRAGTPLVVRNQFMLGSNAANTRLYITNGGTLRVDGVSATNFTNFLQAITSGAGSLIGFATNSTGNQAIISGAGSYWTNTTLLAVGGFGSGNQLVISNGAEVDDGFDTNTYFSAIVGGGDSSSNNSVLVTGPNTNSDYPSLWINPSELDVGLFGSGNQLVVSNGAEVDCYDYLVIGDSSSNNTVLVTGYSTNSGYNSFLGSWQLEVGGDGSAGGDGSGNQLVISNHAEVDAPCDIGANLSSNNTVLVNDDGWLDSFNDGLDIYGSSDQLIISNGGEVDGQFLHVHGISNDMVLVTGYSTNQRSLCDSYELEVDHAQLVVSNGAGVFSDDGTLGYNSNIVTVTGSGSVWAIETNLIVGFAGSANSLTISNGGSVVDNANGIIGRKTPGQDNQVVVTDPGSTWTTTDLKVGLGASGSSLTVTNEGKVAVKGDLYLGQNAGSSNNTVVLAGGDIAVSGVVDVRRGTLELDSGTLTTGTLLATNGTEGAIGFNGGTLSVNSAVVIGSPFLVGDAFSGAPANFCLSGNGPYTFNDGLTVYSLGTLEGDGTISGVVTMYGGLFPGPSGGPYPSESGTIYLNSSPVLLGEVDMGISASGNSQLVVGAPLTYGGMLIVDNLGPTALALGDTFHLFNAQSYSGAFSGLTLPPLNAGLMWTNRLLIDGSIAVVPQSPPTINAVRHSGANLIFDVTGGSPGGAYHLLTSTNLALPFSSWTTNRSGFFDWLGNVTITHGIKVGEPQRFFTISWP